MFLRLIGILFFIFNLGCDLRVTGPLSIDSFTDSVPLDAHRIFISSTRTTGRIGATGLGAADELCNSLAASAGLARPYRALLSTSTIDAKNRFANSAALYAVGPDGAYLVTQSLNENLVTVGAVLENRITHTETTQTPAVAGAWTGTTTSGVHSISCSDWTEGGGVDNGVSGLFTFYSKSWTSAASPMCSSELHLYCVSAAWNGSSWVF